jgi:hypothetical protein
VQLRSVLFWAVVWVILACCLRTYTLSKNVRHPSYIVAHTVPQKNRDLYLSKSALGPYQISYLVGTGGSFTGDKAVRAWCWPLTSSSAKCSISGAILIPPKYTFLVCKGTTLLLLYTTKAHLLLWYKYLVHNNGLTVLFIISVNYCWSNIVE